MVCPVGEGVSLIYSFGGGSIVAQYVFGVAVWRVGVVWEI